MVGNEISRISSINNIGQPSQGSNSSGINLIPALLIMASIITVGTLIVIYAQRKIDEAEKLRQ